MCRAHKTLLRNSDFCLYKVSAFFFVFPPQYFKCISFIFKGNCLCGLCSDGENKHPRLNSSEYMCAILVHAILLNSGQKSGFLSLFSITALGRTTCQEKCLNQGVNLRNCLFPSVTLAIFLVTTVLWDGAQNRVSSRQVKCNFIMTKGVCEIVL